MKHLLAGILLHKPVPALWQLALWVAGGIAALFICSVQPGPIAIAAMQIQGALLVAIWYRYTHLAVWTKIFDQDSLALKLAAVTGSVLMASAFALVPVSS